MKIAKLDRKKCDIYFVSPPVKFAINLALNDT